MTKLQDELHMIKLQDELEKVMSKPAALLLLHDTSNIAGVNKEGAFNILCNYFQHMSRVAVRPARIYTAHQENIKNGSENTKSALEQVIELEKLESNDGPG